MRAHHNHRPDEIIASVQRAVIVALSTLFVSVVWLLKNWND